jgi:hypothetical protein
LDDGLVEGRKLVSGLSIGYGLEQTLGEFFDGTADLEGDLWLILQSFDKLFNEHLNALRLHNEISVVFAQFSNVPCNSLSNLSILIIKHVK